MPTHSPQEIRQRIQRRFSKLAGEEQPIQGETLLVRSGEYCGHRYQAESMSAIWFLEEEEVKFYNADGGVLEVVYTNDSAGQERRAA